eukprot:scaffold240254_cov17-Tisochrysis_lutea.AAC.1
MHTHTLAQIGTSWNCLQVYAPDDAELLQTNRDLQIRKHACRRWNELHFIEERSQSVSLGSQQSRCCACADQRAHKFYT